MAAPAGIGLLGGLGDSGLGEDVAVRLAAVEDALRAATVSEYPLLTEASGHLIAAGGKRFRPLLTLLMSHYGPTPQDPRVVPAATVVELTHLATLYHDDVMDEAAVRRGTTSANARWSNTVAILAGDFLFSRASQILADLGPEAVRLQAQTFERLVTGQIRETIGPEPGEDPISHYLQVLALKTGSLIATAARFGTLMAGASPQVVESAARFGERLGVAFQISDDLIDLTSDAGESGKTPGTDLREGILTLPALLALGGTEPTGSRLRTLLGHPLTDPAELAEALSLLRAHPAVEQARGVLAEWVRRTREELRLLPAGPVSTALADVCTGVLTRSG